MRLSDYIKRMIHTYFIVFAIIVITLTVLRQIFAPELGFELKDIYMYMVCAFVSVLPGFILYSGREISEKERRLRILLHFAALETVILTLANVMGWVNGVQKTLFLGIQVLVIYLMVCLVFWLDNRQTANKINKKLELLKVEADESPHHE